MRQIEDLSELPEGKGWLVGEFGAGTKEEAEERAREAMKALHGHPSMKLYTDKRDQQRIWDVRESGLAATAFVGGEPLSWPGGEDSAVAPGRVCAYRGCLREHS